MKKVINNVIAYGMWIIDIALAFWLIYISREAYQDIFALFYKQGDTGYSHMTSFIDKAIMIVLSLGWLGLMIYVEEYFRVGIQKGNLLKRVARITGLVLLGLGGVDLLLIWLQNISSQDWLSWLMLAGELGIGLALLMYSRTAIPLKSN
jgi:hypothetical protein